MCQYRAEARFHLPTGRKQTSLGAEAGSLAAGHAHMAWQGRVPMPSINHEIMPPGLARDGFVYRNIQEIIAF